MPKILEELQARVTESKLTLDLATKAFQQAQSAFTLAQQDHNTWNLALQAEQRAEQRRTTAAAEKQLSLPTAQPQSKPEREEFVDAVLEIDDGSEQLNKTDTVRDLLRRHPAGMTAVDIWQEVREDFKHRPYLYSVLKRLRDREEIIKRRGRYCLKITPKTQEAQAQPVVH